MQDLADSSLCSSCPPVQLRAKCIGLADKSDKVQDRLLRQASKSLRLELEARDLAAAAAADLLCWDCVVVSSCMICCSFCAILYWSTAARPVFSLRAMVGERSIRSWFQVDCML